MTLNELRNAAGRAVTRPFVSLLVRTGVTPDALTLVGLAVFLGAAVLVGLGNFVAGGILIIASGVFDLLDGALARATQRTTPFGALLDSTSDRLAEGAIFLALVVFFAPRGMYMEAFLAVAALIGSFLISYIRARAEGLNTECKVGFFTRAERIAVLVAGLLLSALYSPIMLIVLWALAILTFATALQRVIYVRLKMRGPPAGK